MKTRRLMPEDWALFRDIRIEMLSEAADAFGSSFTDWVAKPEAEVRARLARMHVLATFERRRIVACAAYVRAASSPARHRAEVISVYTRPEARGQGLQTALLRDLGAAARGEGILQLELQVAVWNRQAIAAYEAVGFTACGTIPRAVCHRGNYSDDLVMVWALDSDSPAT